MTPWRLAIREWSIQAPGSRTLVERVSLSVHDGQTLAIVGESGSGKSLTALSILGLLPPGLHSSAGRILWREDDGSVTDLGQLSESRRRQFRGGHIGMIFQEPMTCLNPVMTVGDQIVEAIELHRGLRGAQARQLAVESFADVGIRDPQRRVRSYPHELSGGMRQRVMIATALACQPRLLIADEPTTALDVTVASQILAMIAQIKRQRGLGVLLITHDMGVVAQNADVVCVMYAGRVVEYAEVATLFADPIHPYTRGLLACVPRLDQRRTRLPTLAEHLKADAAPHPCLAQRGLAAWWPHAPDAPSPGSELIDVGGRFVRVQTPAGGQLAPATDPDLAFVRPAREDAGRCAS